MIMNSEIIRVIEDKIADLKRRWPAHSVPPIMFQELEELEEELVIVIEQSRKGQNAQENSSY